MTQKQNKHKRATGQSQLMTAHNGTLKDTTGVTMLRQCYVSQRTHFLHSLMQSEAMFRKAIGVCALGRF
jgi:hypothetical protein